MRPALALAAALAGTLACGSSDTPSCPGNLVETFHFEGSLVGRDDASKWDIALDPVPEVLDCTPVPLPDPLPNPPPPILYPEGLPPFDAKLAADPASTAAALCRSNGIFYLGERTGTSHYEVEAGADPALPCGDSLCTATLRVVMRGDVAVDGAGAPQSFTGVLVEVLTEDRGVCDACLPTVPTANPPVRECAARYTLTGTLR